MPVIAVLDFKVAILLLVAAVVVIGPLVLIVLGLLYGLNKIFGDRFKVNDKIEFKATTLMVLCALPMVFLMLVVVVDENRTDKAITASVVVGALAALGVSVRWTKLSKVQPEDTSGTPDGSE